MDEFLLGCRAYLHMTETEFVSALVVMAVLTASLVRFFSSLMKEGRSSNGHAKVQTHPKPPGGGPSMAGGVIE
jgi:hypothetical protein